MLFLFLFERLLYPETELGIWLGAVAVLLPFITFLALVIQVLWLKYRIKTQKRSAGRLTETTLAALGPIGLAWAVFILTRSPHDDDDPDGVR